jgi:septum formation protein
VTSLLATGSRPLILASRSPRREAILRQLGVPHLVKPADVEESSAADLPPREQAMAAAARKAAAIARQVADGIVLGADTIVVVDGDQVLGKPRSPEEAAAMLTRLMGRIHLVTTGLALIDVATGARSLSWEDTRVTMRKAAPAEIAAYVATGEPLDKAGAYGIQGQGAVFVERIEGCYYNVVGLPVYRLVTMLEDLRAPNA